MKKFFFLIIFVFLNTYVEGQSSKSLSIGVLYSGLSGLNAELGYNKLITNRIGITGRAAYNFKESYSFRAGLSYSIFNITFIKIDLGAEYNYDRHKVSKANGEIISRNLEVPLTIRVPVFSSLELYGGMSSSINLNDTEVDRLVDNLRIGLRFRL